MTARRRRRKRRNLRPRESKEPSVSDELKDDLPPKTKFRCLIWFVLFWVVLIGLVTLILNYLDPSDWQKRIDSGNPPRIEEVVSFGDDLYYDSNDYETGIRHVVWEIESDSYEEGPTVITYKVAEFKNDLMTKFVTVATDDEVTKIIREWNTD